MQLEVDDVIAHALYDPVARRERYLRNRHLKGKGTPNQTPVKAGVGSRVVESGLAASNRHFSGHVNQTAIRQAASNAKQVAEIRGKLDKLKSHLKDLLAKKKAASTSGPKSSTSSKEDAPSKDSKPKTAAQKAAAKKSLKKAQEERAKQQKSEPDKKTPPTLDEQITKTRAVIADVEIKLRSALDNAQPKTASNGR